jgi:hypothetical protein
LALFAVVVLPACGSPIFAVDQRVQIVSPSPMSSVGVPLRVRWTSHGTSSPGYAVFLDRAPIAPGHGVRDVADRACKITPGCPDAGYLAGKGVYLTSRTEVVIADIQARNGTDSRRKHPMHVLTLVRMDRSGHRLGEASWRVEFRA